MEQENSAQEAALQEERAFDVALHARQFERHTEPQIAAHKSAVQEVMRSYPQVSNGQIHDALWRAQELESIAEYEIEFESSELGSRDRVKIARLEHLRNDARRCAGRLEQWRLNRLAYRTIHAADRIVWRQFGDPGIPAADIVAARYGSAKAQLQVQGWVSELVRNAALARLNSRSRSPQLLSVTTADVYAEIVDGAAKWSREAAAQEAGVAKATYVNFRAAIFDPVSSALSLYLQRVALASRHVKMPRSRHHAPYRKVRDANADNPVSMFGFRAARISSGHDPHDEKIHIPRSGLIALRGPDLD